nr:MAG TPA: Kinocilin protein [Microviridae sp.]
MTHIFHYGTLGLPDTVSPFFRSFFNLNHNF